MFVKTVLQTSPIQCQTVSNKAIPNMINNFNSKLLPLTMDFPLPNQQSLCKGFIFANREVHNFSLPAKHLANHKASRYPRGIPLTTGHLANRKASR